MEHFKIPDIMPRTYTALDLKDKVQAASTDSEALSLLLGQLVSFGYHLAVSEYAKRVNKNEQ